MLFRSHAGLEWDITTTTAAERAVLASWAQYYKVNRELLHSGRLVRVDHPEPAVSIHGVIARDSSRAIFAYVQAGVTTSSRAIPLRLPGLAADQQYLVREVRPAGPPRYWEIDAASWRLDSIKISGAALAEVGLTAPMLTSEQAMLLEVTAV